MENSLIIDCRNLGINHINKSNKEIIKCIQLKNQYNYIGLTFSGFRFLTLPELKLKCKEYKISYLRKRKQILINILIKYEKNKIKNNLLKNNNLFCYSDILNIIFDYLILYDSDMDRLNLINEAKNIIKYHNKKYSKNFWGFRASYYNTSYNLDLKNNYLIIQTFETIEYMNKHNIVKYIKLLKFPISSQLTIEEILTKLHIYYNMMYLKN